MGGRGATSGSNSISLIDDNRMHKIDFNGGYVKYVLHHETQGDNIYIDELHTDSDKRGRGIGTNMLNSMKKVADKSNATIELSAFPFDRGMTASDLIKWYENRGFSHVGSNKMKYTPKRRR